MEIHQIRYFPAVERERNFTRAAECCHITQPALTRAIQKLELDLGGPLFCRQPGRIELTELGRTLLPHLKTVDREVESARNDAKRLADQRKQRLRIGVMCTLAPGVFVGLLRQLRDDIGELEIQLIEAKGAAVVAALLGDDIDIGLVGLPHYRETIDVVPLYTERYALAVPSRHRFSSLGTVALAQLDGEDYVERLNCEFDDHFQSLHGDWPVQLNVRYQTEREDWAQAMISSGLGMAVVPQSMPLVQGVSRVGLNEPIISRTISMVTLRDREQPRAVGAFLQIVQNYPWITGSSSAHVCFGTQAR